MILLLTLLVESIKSKNLLIIDMSLSLLFCNGLFWFPDDIYIYKVLKKYV